MYNYKSLVGGKLPPLNENGNCIEILNVLDLEEFNFYLSEYTYDLVTNSHGIEYYKKTDKLVEPIVIYTDSNNKQMFNDKIIIAIKKGYNTLETKHCLYFTFL